MTSESETSVLVPLAEDFEEIEAIVPVDVWRRAGWKVTTAGLDGPGPVRASRDTRHLPDLGLDEALGQPWTLIYLPGGRPGADHLRDHSELTARLEKQAREELWIAAICAAPISLHAAGLLEGKNFTCHPGAAEEISSGTRTGERVVRDGKLLTGLAAGAAMELALAVLQAISGEEAVERVNAGLLAWL